MDRFSVIYLQKKQYCHIYCRTHSEATSVLGHLFTLVEHAPIGIYDAKTELFSWEPERQHAYNLAGIEEQGQLADQIILLSQTLRQQKEPKVEVTDAVGQLIAANN